MVAGGAGDRGAGGHAQLHRGNADPARGAVHEQPVAVLQVRLCEERVVCRCEHLDETARLRPVDALRHADHVRVVHGDELRLASAWEQGHHPLAGLDVLAGALQAWNVGGRARRRRVAAGTLQQIGAVDAGSSNAASVPSKC